MRKYPTHIEFYTGPMCSGKTTSFRNRMTELYQKATYQKKNAQENIPVYYRFTLEKLASPKQASVLTHGGEEIHGWLINSFRQIENESKYIFIDEIQFAFYHCFDEESDIEFEKKKFFEVAANKNVYIAGLNLDWQDRPFYKSTGFFMCLANKIYFLNAHCHRCGQEAKFSEKLTKDERRFDEIAEYRPICRECRIKINEASQITNETIQVSSNN